MPTTPAGRAADFIAPVDHGELPRWELADLPAPPPFGMRNLFKIIGPGAIMAATSIGGGEWLVGPAAAVKYSSSIFLIATIAIVLQVVFNIEAVRYTLYTGEPIYGGIMRLKPGPKFWAVFYSFLGFFQLGWPALAGSAAATLLGAWMGRMPGAPDQATQAWVATGLMVFVVFILSFGGTIERMLEYFAWTMLCVVFLFLLVDQHRLRAVSALVAHLHRLLQLHRAAAADRLGPDRRARRDRRLRRTRESHRHELGPRQGLRHGGDGRRHPERRRRTRDQVDARRQDLPGDTARTSCDGASG